jgi:hypothetical protein
MLHAAFDRPHFFSLRERYLKSRYTHRPVVITTYSRDGLTRVVEHSRGDPSAPQALTVLEDEFERIVQSDRRIRAMMERTGDMLE